MGLEVETVAEWQRGKKSGLSQWGGRKSEEETLTLKEASLYSRPKQVIRQQFLYPFHQLGEHEIIKPAPSNSAESECFPGSDVGMVSVFLQLRSEGNEASAQTHAFLSVLSSSLSKASTTSSSWLSSLLLSWVSPSHAASSDVLAPP